MRVGVSDSKNAMTVVGFKRHRVIMPVNIPRLGGYYEHALEVLDLCLSSLHVTAGSQISVTVVSNQCCPEAVARILHYHERGWIDQVVLNAENRGRIDAVTNVARGAFEEIITLTDCDVLFRPGWLEAVETLFHTFPECGMASMSPHAGLGWHHTSATVLGAWLRRELAWEKAIADEDIDLFGHSIGVPNYVKPAQRAAQMVVRRAGQKALVGCPHFVFSIRRDAVSSIPREPNLSALGLGVDELWYDKPPDVHGYWRLTTRSAYANHIGNVPESWMYEDLKRWRDEARAVTPAPAVQPVRRPVDARLPYLVRVLLVGALRRLHLERAFERRARREMAQAAGACDGGASAPTGMR